jgi:hypothetical protein
VPKTKARSQGDAVNRPRKPMKPAASTEAPLNLRSYTNQDLIVPLERIEQFIARAD